MRLGRTFTLILALIILIFEAGKSASGANLAEYDLLAPGSRSEDQLVSSNFALVRGRVTDAITGEGIRGATIAFAPGSFSLTTGLNGAFFSATTPAGIYSVSISAERHETRFLNRVKITPGVINELSTVLLPRAPIVSATALEGFNDGLLPVLITAQVTHPDGIQNVTSVSADLSGLGGKTEQSLYDDATHGDRVAGDGTYSYQTILHRQTRARKYPVIILVRDTHGFSGFGALSLDVIERIVSAIGPAASDLRHLINDISGQTLTVSLRVISLRLPAASEGTGEEACVILMVYDPNGELYGTYPVDGSIDITIPGAESGEWTFETVNQCDTTLDYQIETRGSGTGMISGRVVDGFTAAGLRGAYVTSNTGGATQTLDQGYFAGVAVAGTGAVMTTLTGYQQNVRAPVTVTAGGTTTLNIQVVPQDSAPQPSPDGQSTCEVLDPAEEPRPMSQPFAAKIAGQNLEFSMLFPAYDQPVDLYVGMTIDYPGLSGKLFLIDQNDNPAEYTGTLVAWRTGVTAPQSAGTSHPFPSSALPPAGYTLYAFVTPSSAAFTHFDLIYFTETFGQPPPQGQHAVFIENPAEDPIPLSQPLAVGVSEGNLFLNAHFPPQQQPVSIYLGYVTPGGEGVLINADDSPEPFTTTLWPWREDVTDEPSTLVISTPVDGFGGGDYTFYTLVTTDPVTFANYELTFFNMHVGERQ
jgi:hypothetical protein